MESASQIVTQLEQLAEGGRSPELEAQLVSALARYPDDGRLWRLSGLLRHSWADYGTAARSLEHASLLIPLPAGEMIVLADSYARIGQSKHSHSILTQLVENADCTADVLPAIAAGFGRIGDFEAAHAACRTAFDRDPNRPEPLFGMVYYLRRMGYSAKLAIPVMARAVELAPDNSFYRATHALLLAEDGRSDEAYDLLCDVPLAEVGCKCLMRRMMAIFQSAGDYDRWRSCHNQLEQFRRPA